MRGILEFNLPEEREEFDMARKSVDAFAALDEISNLIRNYCKYGPNTTSASILVDRIRDEIAEIRERREV